MTTLTAVRTALHASPSPHASSLNSLIDFAQISPLKTNTQAVIARFGPEKIDFPQKGRGLSPFDPATLPSITELRDILLQDLEQTAQDGTSQPEYFPPPSSCGESDDDDDDDAGNISEHDAAADLINHVTDADYETSGVIPHLPSSTLDALCNAGKENWDDVLFETPTTVSVLSANTPLTLQHHNESTSFSTLLTGTVVYVVWPPTPHNFTVLQDAYDAFATSSFDDTALDVSHRLEGGVTFVQSARETLRLPPFCLLRGLATTTAVLATYSIVTADTFVSMLHALPLLTSFWATETHGAAQKTAFGAALLDCLERILACEFEDEAKVRHPVAPRGPLSALLRAWDGVRHDVFGVLDAETTARMKRAWMAFLVRVVGRNCVLCGRKFMCKRNETRAHFEKTHWVGGQGEGGSEERVDSMGVE
ncbi:hypothetical protein BDV95DRAFT_649511 [Massariosphaeria phaeospora]|uniref:Uncharacterized protein n=1 Tax=Massariosphaeria phaeospora TaxID=100035 RepID=A0A7C8I605_9PLEO|nr:hypothetical protein BDV95DRAFT_649511 [Massariosphaeria phaeospora]